MGKRAVLSLLALLVAPTVPAIETKDIEAGVTAQEIAQLLTGPGVTISNVKITGSNKAIGTFTGGGSLGMNSGVILSSGDIATAAGPNATQGSGTPLGTAGDPDLNALVTPFLTHDAVIFEFDAVTETPNFSIQYVFASDEYKEYVGDVYNDVFAFFVGGKNIALAPTGEPVTVNTINHIKNTASYRDNPPGLELFDTEYDGFTSPLIAFATVTPGVPFHIKIALADASDPILDSAVLIAAGGISGAAGPPVIIPQYDEITLTNLQTYDLPLTLYGVTEDTVEDITFRATGLPEDSKVEFSEIEHTPDNFYRNVAKVTIGPDTPAGRYVVTMNGILEGAESTRILIVNVFCDPPLILGTNQPKAATVARGGNALLEVTPTGTGPYSYQWYSGATGATRFPIAGATSRTFRTAALNDTSYYWVRVSNPCGSTDSNTTAVTVTQPVTTPTRKRGG